MSIALRVAVVLGCAAGCHVVAHNELVRPGGVERVRRAEEATAGAPALVLTEAGQLRFVEPLTCPTDEVITEQRGTEIVTGPNLATFIVGVIATSTGAIFAVQGVTGDDAANPFLVGGLGALAVGLPLAIGPWIGNGVELRPSAIAPVRRPGPPEPCGARPLAARAATLAIRGIEVRGAVGADGVFSVSPYDLIDAYEGAAAVDVAAALDGGRTLQAVLPARALAAGATAFLARAPFDAAVQPMRLVPRIGADAPRASLVATPDGPAVRVALTVRNDGPGAAWAVRGHIVAPAAPALDGRVIYIGALAKSAAITRELLIPLREAAAGALRGAPLDLSVELRDAHGAAPRTPIRFRGALVDAAP